ncbi:response regulator transcription factor [Flavobacterium sp.]|uniref:response regulator transcription factor n=1 Tax=Flavobacterium sp. TaxID=239 RepID=UPI00286BDFB7|nr:response regulator transcription factor [Flavobacterium sp.]
MRDNPIKVFLVDDHQMVIEGIKTLLLGENCIQLVGAANNAEMCLQFFKMQTSDVILMDINLPDSSGIELCKIITSKYPSIKVIALSTHNQGTYVRKMLESGATGYLLKNADKHEIIKAIQTVYNGTNYLTYEADRALRYENELQNKLPKLTKREKEVLILIVEGLTNAQISEKLFISIDTVDSHRKNLHTKLEVKNTAMLIKFATENNLL